MKRQTKILAACLLLLLSAGLYAWWETPRPQRVSEVSPTHRQTAPVRRAAPVQAQAAEQEARLRLDLLEPRRESFPGYQRDLFGALFSAPIAPPPPPAPPMPTRPPAPEITAPPVTSVVLEPSVHFEVLGYVVINGIKTVFLEEEGEVFLAREGQIFADEYRVIGLSEDFLVIEQQGQSRPIILSLPEAAPAPRVPARPAPRRK